MYLETIFFNNYTCYAIHEFQMKIEITVNCLGNYVIPNYFDGPT